MMRKQKEGEKDEGMNDGKEKIVHQFYDQTCFGGAGYKRERSQGIPSSPITYHRSGLRMRC